jgi:hypothetical protein
VPVPPAPHKIRREMHDAFGPPPPEAAAAAVKAAISARGTHDGGAGFARAMQSRIRKPWLSRVLKNITVAAKRRQAKWAKKSYQRP